MTWPVHRLQRESPRYEYVLRKNTKPGCWELASCRVARHLGPRAPQPADPVADPVITARIVALLADLERWLARLWSALR